jgi:hypothetical protein
MSSINRRKTRSLTGLVILMLLFAQSLFAALPCQVPDRNPAMAFDDMAGMDCAQKGNPNACLQQCVGGDQSASHVQFAVAPMPLLAALILPVADPQVIPPSFTVAHSVHSPDPPPSIRFCSLQL